MRLVVVSPHLDDAVLCTGGGMGIARSLGIEVLIVTVFTANGTTTRTEGLSDYARAFHRQCGLDDHDAVAARRTEDANAANVLDVDYRWLDLPDALYRTGHDGPLYKSEAMLFGPPRDPESLGVLARNLLTEQLYPDDAVLLPLSVGHHVDHVLVRAWGEAAGRSAQTPLSYYEESLYADQHGAEAWASVDIDGLQRLHLALPPSGHALKQRAVAAYASQLMMLGVDPNNPADGDAFMTRLAAEGYWRRLHPGSPAHQHSRRMTIDQDFMRLVDL